MKKTDKEIIENLQKKLEFAERSWKDASQANFLMEKKISDNEEEIKELREYKKSYLEIINSKTWKLSKKLKRMVGIK